MSKIFDFIKTILKVSLVIFLILIVCVLLYCEISACEEKQQQIHDCFIQEPRTKECEYILWQEELKARRAGRNSQNNIATGMLLGTAMGMSMGK